MGLDACVYCDCVEKAKIQVPHPYPEWLFIAESGRPEVDSDNEEVNTLHEEWLFSDPCEHYECCVEIFHLANIGLAGLFREIIEKQCADPGHEFPVIYGEVIYSGSHCGDWIEVQNVQRMPAEIERLRTFDLSHLSAERQAFWPEFLDKMEALANASLLVNKPIAF